MKATQNIAASRHHSALAPLAIAGLALLLIAVTAIHLERAFPASAWRDLLVSSGDMQAATLYYSALPRLAVALMAGACLGLASSVMQVVLRNPIAEPATLGVSGGATLALTAASVFAPALLGDARDIIGITGAAATMLVVVGLAIRQNLSPIRLILGGLIVSLLCGTANAMLALFHHDNLQGMFIWNAGSLVQNDWHVVRRLLIQMSFAIVLLAILLRPLTVLQLQDESARGLGLSLARIRLLALAASVFLSAAVTNAVGVIGFVGLAGATLARATGTRRLPHRLFLSTLIGALLLATVDQGLQLLTGSLGEIPAGGLTALLGAPLLLRLLRRLGSVPTTRPDGQRRPDRRHVWPAIAFYSFLLLLLTFLATTLTHDASRWHFALGAEFRAILPWRWPRSLAAVSAGFVLGIAGVMSQRFTGNPLASPEVLGVSSGAGLGALATVLAFNEPDRTTQMASGAVGAILTLALIVALARRSAFSPERLLLAGIAVGTLFSGALTFLLTTGDPRVHAFLVWMAGSLTSVSAHDAMFAFSFALLAAATLPLLRRWLAILPLGTSSARAIGVNDNMSGITLMIAISILTTVPTMIVGPLSFIGLMSPHIVRMAGFRRPLEQAFAAGLIGAIILLAADILGRSLLFPYEIPAGLMASMIGAPYFLLLMRRSE
ncbi:MAG: Fe(3+)-hydroxamate ABC transporter permease FhuB [Rhizobium sp.]|nr:MAG: Fe(3+)-hydroxamate ABC transporter permease FhuB [Rhizobium sp.]